MAEQQQEEQPQQNSSPSLGNTFDKGMNKDLADNQMGGSMYFNAINASTSLPDGGMNRGLSIEAANRLSLSKVPLVMIGREYMRESEWVTFWTDDTLSEIGIYNELTDSYTLLINDSATLAAGLPGMGFKRTNLITCATRRGFDCGFDVYWSDGRLNPDRFLDTSTCPFNSANPNLQPNPWFQTSTVIAGCTTFTNTDLVDIRQLLLIPQYNVPCLQLGKSNQSGILSNGQYQVCIAYTINGFKATDYMALSNTQSIWSHVGEGGGLVLKLSNLETVTFIEMEVVVVSLVNLQVQAKRLGLYSTTETTIYIDNLSDELVTIPIADIPLTTPAVISSDMLATVSGYLVRSGVTNRPDPNYQPIANQITAKWVCVEYPDDYYAKNNPAASGISFVAGSPTSVGYMRGEVYAYYVRGVYTTGDKTASYPLIGPTAAAFASGGFSVGGPSVGDGSVTLCSGIFDTYSSLEIYPNDRASVWNSNIPGHPEWDVCGQPIRWFKFPDQASFAGPAGDTLSHFWNYGTPLVPDMRIRVMGVYFDNIQPFRDNNNQIIADIQGYEILRATRDGNASILAKGMINNMRQVTDNIGTQQLLSNYPYNDLGIDVFLTNNYSNITTGATGNGFNSPLPDYASGGFNPDIWSFHSPETVFQHPYLGTGTLRAVMGMNGISRGIFEAPYKHPLFKVLTDFDSTLTIFIGAIQAFITILNVVSGGSNSLTLAATDELPYINPLGVSIPDLTVAGTNVLGDAVYVAMLAANVTMAFILAPLQAAILAQQISNVIKGLIPGRQFALQYNSAGYYNTARQLQGGTFSSAVTDYDYIQGQMQTFAGLTVNNLYRNDYVAVQTQTVIPPYANGDAGSRFNLGAGTRQPGQWYNTQIGSYYATYSVPQPTQYGQVDSAKQVPIGCMQLFMLNAAGKATSSVMFGGDTYINRYTEKNPMLFFNDWLVGAPEDIIYDYRNYINVPYPMFWLDNDVNTNHLLGLAHDNRRLDGPLNTHLFFVDKGYFYLFCNGVRDFYVESTINVGFRDYGEQIQQKFYDPYGFTDVNQMFRSDIIKTPAFYKYDYSLSANRFWNQWLTWSRCLQRDFDPTLAYTCFAYYPRRVVYSLPQSEELRHDNWRTFLPNNYKDFPSRVTAIKPISQTGAMFLQEDAPPVQFQGTASISSTNGMEFTTGTGLLFNQDLQSVSNTDQSLQYGSCQSKFSCINTPYSVFWISQRTGKIFVDAPGKVYFNQGDRMVDIATYGMKYWLVLFLPCKLLESFPTYPYTDNPVIGVGTQLVYDNVKEIVYICKKDYVPVDGYDISLNNGQFYLNSPISGTAIPIALTDSQYFDDASWTLSYDPKAKKFISFHSWTPTLVMQGEKHIITCDPTGTSLWKHNEISDAYGMYYGTQYNFEIEMPLNTGDSIVTLENVELILDSFNYRPNQVDKFNPYADFFTSAQVFNEEQSSLPLLLNPTIWNNPYDRLNYPNTVAGGRNILYTKVENRFRFTNFRDFCNDRSQFDLGTQQMKQTSANGYVWTPVTAFFDWFKNDFQLKKIRHRSSRLWLCKDDITVNSLTLTQVKTNVKPSMR